MQLGFDSLHAALQLRPGPRSLALCRPQPDPAVQPAGHATTCSTTCRTGRASRSSSSYPLRRSFARVGLSYGYDRSNIAVANTCAKKYFQYIEFPGPRRPELAAPASAPADVTPSYTYNTVNHPITPTGGSSLFISTQFAGSFLGGNVNMIQPTIDAKYFRPSPEEGARARLSTAMARCSPATAARWRRLSTASTWAASRTSAASKSGASARWRSSRARPPSTC